ncbi:MAG: hypothetical protein K8R76_12265 [Candidatus Aegiribacteria sp.]|nr:hypothetical protein [Candidatus Aegiribacteria sp.]
MPVAVYFIAGALFLVAVLVHFLKRLQTGAMKEVLREYPSHTHVIISPMANMFGLKSKGVKQIRGNGVLVLTSSLLYFRMLIPAKKLIIPVSSITGVETPKSFAGKTKGVKLLKVDFRTADGKAESAAWLVDRLEDWVSSLNKLI